MQQLDKRRRELEQDGYLFVSERKVRANESCPCKSGRKFKHCCTSNVVRAAGATFIKPGASRYTARKL